MVMGYGWGASLAHIEKSNIQATTFALSARLILENEITTHPKIKYFQASETCILLKIDHLVQAA